MEKDSRPQRFVEEILNRCSKDKGFAAQMRRADNANTEFFSLYNGFALKSILLPCICYFFI